MAKWYLSPTGSDSNTGQTDNATTGAFLTPAHLIAGNRLQTNDEIFLYPYAQVGTYTARLNVPGYGGADYISQVSNGIGRDINNVTIHGRGALWTSVIPAGDADGTEQCVTIAPTGWLIEDVTFHQTGSTDGTIEFFTVFMGPSGTLRNCTIAGTTCTAWGNPFALDHTGNPYDLSGPVNVHNCQLLGRIAAIDMGGQTGTLSVTECNIVITYSAGFSIGFVLSSGPNLFKRNNITVIGAAGNTSQTASIVFISVDPSPLTVEDCNILQRGRTSQANVRLMGYGDHAFSDVKFKNTVVVATEDCEANVTFGSFTAVNSIFITDPSGSNGPRKTWSATHSPRVVPPLMEVTS